MKKKLSHTMIVGLVPAILEFLLVFSVEPTASPWLLTQVTLFWFTCGATVHRWDAPLNIWVKSLAVTVFLNSPWYIAESVLKGKPEHFPPLLIASIVQGLIIGLLCKLLTKNQPA